MKSRTLDILAQQNQAQELLWAKQLYAYLEEAAKIESERANNPEEDKTPNPVLVLAVDFIKDLDTNITNLKKYFTLSKSTILSTSIGNLYRETGKVSFGCIHLAIQHRLNSVLDLLIEQGASLADAAYVAAISSNHYAFQKIRSLASANTEEKVSNEDLLYAALVREKPKTKQEQEDQEKIVDDLLEEKTQTTGVGRSAHHDSLYVAATTAQSASIVRKLIQISPQDPGWTKLYLRTCIEQTTPENKTEMAEIISLLLSHFEFTNDELDTAFMLAIEHNLAVDCPKVMQDLKDKGVTISQQELDGNIAQEISEARQKLGSGLEKACKRILALSNAGARINYSLERGSSLLTDSIINPDSLLIETIIEAEPQFTQKQLDLALWTSICMSNKLDHIIILLKNGAKIFNNQSVEDFIERLIIHCITATEEKCKQVTAYIRNEIAVLSTEDKNKTLLGIVYSMIFFSTVKNEMSDNVIIDLLKAGADVNLRNEYQGRTILFYAIYYKRKKIIHFICHSLLGKIKWDEQGKFYYNPYIIYPDTIDKSVSFDLEYERDKKRFTKVSDLFLLTQLDDEIVEDLMHAGAPLSKYGFQMINLCYANAKDSLRELWEKIDNYSKQYGEIIKRIKHLESSSKAADEKSFELQPMSVNSQTSSERRVLTIEEVKSEDPSIIEAMEVKQLSKLKLPSLVNTLNTVLSEEILNVINEEKPNFNRTIAFLAKLKEARYDYISVLADKENLPLAHIFSMLSDKANSAKLEEAVLQAAQLLLNFAPFTQLNQLQPKTEKFKKIKPHLTERCEKFLAEELKDSKANLVDLAFYIQQRAEKPGSDDFIKRGQTFITVVKKLEKAKDQKEFEAELKEQISVSTKGVKKGQAAHILMGIKRTLSQETPATETNNFTQFKLFSREHDSYIKRAKVNTENLILQYKRN